MKDIERTEEKKIRALLSQRKFEKADPLIHSLIKEDPENAHAYYLKGTSHYFKNEIGKAIESLERSVELDPKHTDSSVCLSVIYNDIGKYEEANSVFEKANQSVIHTHVGADREIDRKFSKKHFELADLYFRYRRYDEAVEEYNKAAMLDPEDFEVRIRRAKVFVKKGFISRAVQDLQELKTEHPRETAIRIQLGLIHYQQKNILDAELEWEGVLDIDPDHSEAKSYLQMAKTSRTAYYQP